MEYYHVLMALVAVIAAGLVSRRRDVAALLGVVLSQLPFWAGLYWDIPGPSDPVRVNMFLSLFAAAGFLLLGHLFGGFALAICCLIFATATILDVTAAFIEIQPYVVFHEVLHYLALILMVGRGYVDRVIGDYRSGAHTGGAP